MSTVNLVVNKILEGADVRRTLMEVNVSIVDPKTGQGHAFEIDPFKNNGEEYAKVSVPVVNAALKTTIKQASSKIRSFYAPSVDKVTSDKVVLSVELLNDLENEKYLSISNPKYLPKMLQELLVQFIQQMLEKGIALDGEPKVELEEVDGDRVFVFTFNVDKDAVNADSGSSEDSSDGLLRYKNKVLSVAKDVVRVGADIWSQAYNCNASVVSVTSEFENDDDTWNIDYRIKLKDVFPDLDLYIEGGFMPYIGDAFMNLSDCYKQNVQVFGHYAALCVSKIIYKGKDCSQSVISAFDKTETSYVYLADGAPIDFGALEFYLASGVTSSGKRGYKVVITDSSEKLSKIYECVKQLAESSEQTVLGATLLSAEEAKKVPKSIRAIDVWWWLRSPGYDSTSVSYVDFVGDVIVNEINNVNNPYAVRPALKLSKNLKIGTQFRFAGETWTVVLPKMALCDGMIREMGFNDSLDDGNDYEYSKVKKYVDSWFAQNKNDLIEIVD